MTEEFLYYIWNFRLFNNCYTSNGEPVNIINVGEKNINSGPDFFNAKIKIGKTVWAGNVEIHINASDWYKHRHHKDKAYNNIILHVVYNNDKIIKRYNNEIIPVLELKGKFDDKLYFNYEQFMNSKLWIPCQNQIKEVETLIVKDWLENLLIERLEKKVKVIEYTLDLCNNSWEQTFYQHLACNFGFKVNAMAFELLAKSLPLIYLAKHKNNLLQIEAMLFGQAGLLNKKFKDEYPKKLQYEYHFLKQKFSLTPVNTKLWKFLRLRPSNFPLIRISQFANLIYKSTHLFSKILECKKVTEISDMFNLSCSEYWDTHYLFDKLSVKRKKHTGKNAINTIIINTIVPFLFLYGIKKDDKIYKERALQFLEQLPKENNGIIKKWDSTGIKSYSAADTQALLELKNNYCDLKKCLNCRIGNYILRQ